MFGGGGERKWCGGSFAKDRQKYSGLSPRGPVETCSGTTAPRGSVRATVVAFQLSVPGLPLDVQRFSYGCRLPFPNRASPFGPLAASLPLLFSHPSISCLPLQSPAYTLVWTRQNNGKLPSRAMDFNGILTIRNVQPEDAGIYICTGSNMFDMDEGTATLYVQGGASALAPC